MMNRTTIADVRALCAEVIKLCDAATAQLDEELAERNYRWPDESRKPSPSDHSYGSRATGSLRRRSMDLTRALADLRGRN